MHRTCRLLLPSLLGNHPLQKAVSTAFFHGWLIFSRPAERPCNERSMAPT